MILGLGPGAFMEKQFRRDQKRWGLVLNVKWGSEGAKSPSGADCPCSVPGWPGAVVAGHLGAPSSLPALVVMG